jgi:hypothetical protein
MHDMTGLPMSDAQAILSELKQIKANLLLIKEDNEQLKAKGDKVRGIAKFFSMYSLIPFFVCFFMFVSQLEKDNAELKTTLAKRDYRIKHLLNSLTEAEKAK